MLELADVFVLEAVSGLEWSRFVASVSYFSGPLQQLHMLVNLMGGEKRRGSPFGRRARRGHLASLVRLIVSLFIHHRRRRETFHFTLVTRSYFLEVRDTTLFFVRSRIDASIADWIEDDITG
jgi:hypothetical protein